MYDTYLNPVPKKHVNVYFIILIIALDPTLIFRLTCRLAGHSQKLIFESAQSSLKELIQILHICEASRCRSPSHCIVFSHSYFFSSLKGTLMLFSTQHINLSCRLWVTSTGINFSPDYFSCIVFLPHPPPPKISGQLFKLCLSFLT